MKNKKIWLIIISVFILGLNIFLPCVSASTSISEEWYKTWGENWMSESGDLTNRAKTLAIDSMDNIYIAGDTEYIDYEDFEDCFSYIRLVKCNSSGIQQWSRTWNASQFDYCEEIALDSSEDIYLCGSTSWNSAGADDICLIKYNGVGKEQWVRTWGGYTNDIGTGLAIDSSDNIYIVGYTGSFGVGSGDLCLLKYDKSGVLQWNVTWGGTEGDGGAAIALDSSDNIYVLGTTSSFGSGLLDICLLKYDSTGIQQWNTFWGGDKYDFGQDITIDTSGNIYITGYTESFGSGGYDICLIKFSNSGVLQWEKILGGSANDYGMALVSDSSNTIYLGGYTNSYGKGQYDLYLAKYNNSGILLSNQTWGGDHIDLCYAMALDSSGNIFFAGQTNSFGSGGDDMILVKVSQDSDEPPDDSSAITIPGYDLLLMICLICTVSVFLIKKRRKSLK